MKDEDEIEDSTGITERRIIIEQNRVDAKFMMHTLREIEGELFALRDSSFSGEIPLLRGSRCNLRTLCKTKN